MSQSNYRAAAATVREVVDGARTEVEVRAASDIAKGLARMFEADNTRFRVHTFYEACGLDENGNVK